MKSDPFIAIPNDTSADALKKQVELLRAAGPQKRLALALSLSQSVKDMALRAIGQRNPQMTREQIHLKWAEIHYGPDIADKVRENLTNRTLS